MNNDEPETRQQRREEKLQKKQERVAKHGRGLARLYKEAIIKRINHLRKEKQKGQEK